MKLSELKAYWRVKRKSKTSELHRALAANVRRAVNDKRCQLNEPYDPWVRIRVITRELQRREDAKERRSNDSGEGTPRPE